jgi:hypothetical protein
MTHEELACGDVIIRTMCPTVDVKGASSANTLTAIVIERYGTAALASFVNCNRIHTFPYKLLIQNIEHLEEGCILFDTRNMISLEMSLSLGVFLTPYL